MTRERGGIVTGFIFKLLLMFAILGVLLYEVGAVIVARVAVDGISADAAREAAIIYDKTDGSSSKARKRCEEIADNSGAECIEVDIDDGFVTVTVRKEAPTLIAHRIGAFERFAVAEDTYRAQVP